MGRGRTFIERNLARFTRLLEDSIFAEETAQKKGWMQQMDPRIKVAATLLLLVGSSFSRSILVILLIYSVSLILAAGSKVFSLSFLKRIWIFMPLYTAFVALPALFLTPGEVLIPLPGPDITQQGLTAATFLVLRVATSVSWMMLLVLTTSWPALLKSLRALGFPRTLVLLLLMTYRYIHVLLHTANSLFLARQSRRLGAESWRHTSSWLGAMLGTLLGKSNQLSNDVYLAMLSRGFRGEPVLMTEFRMKAGDFAWMILLFLLAGWTLYAGWWIQS